MNGHSRRRRWVWLCAGVLVFAVCVAIPVRRRQLVQDRVVAAAKSRPASASKSAPAAKRDFQRTLTSAQVAERVALLDVVGDAEGRRNLGLLLDIANDHFDARRYEAAEVVADAIVAIAPNNRDAKGLKEDAARAGINCGSYESLYRKRRERSRSGEEEFEEQPFDEDRGNPHVHLGRATWKRLLQWARNPLRAEPPLPGDVYQPRKVHEDEEIVAIQGKLETCKIDLDFIDSSLYDIVDFIQEFAKINIVIDARVRKDGIPDRKISFASRDHLLKDVLRDLLDQYGLAWTFENRVLLITTVLLAEGKPVLQVHDVHDLLEGGKWSPEALEAQIKDSIETTSWIEREGEVSIALTKNRMLLVVHTPKVQGRIRALLEALRLQK